MWYLLHSPSISLITINIVYILNNAFGVFSTADLREINEMVWLHFFIHMHKLETVHVAQFVHYVPIIILWNENLKQIHVF